VHTAASDARPAAVWRPAWRGYPARPGGCADSRRLDDPVHALVNLPDPQDRKRFHATADIGHVPVATAHLKLTCRDCGGDVDPQPQAPQMPPRQALSKATGSSLTASALLSIGIQERHVGDVVEVVGDHATRAVAVLLSHPQQIHLKLRCCSCTYSYSAALRTGARPAPVNSQAATWRTGHRARRHFSAWLSARSGSHRTRLAQSRCISRATEVATRPACSRPG
jgi:hypothetical protein